MVMQNRKMRVVSVLMGMLLWVSLNSGTVFTEEYYSNDFEDKDDVSFWTCNGGVWENAAKSIEAGCFTLNSRGIVEEKAYSGVRSFKLDITLKGKEGNVYNYWRGPVTMKIPLDKPVYLSGYICMENVSPGILVKLGWIINGINPKRKKVETGNSPIKDMIKADRKWVFFQQEISEAVKKKGWSADSYLQGWYIHISSGKKLNGRVIIYVDDVKISSEKIEHVGAQYI